MVHFWKVDASSSQEVFHLLAERDIMKKTTSTLSFARRHPSTWAGRRRQLFKLLERLNGEVFKIFYKSFAVNGELHEKILDYVSVKIRL